MGGFSLIEYLNDPGLVADFQKFFGVGRTFKKSQLKQKTKLSDSETENEYDFPSESNTQCQISESLEITFRKSGKTTQHCRTDSSGSSGVSSSSSLEEAEQDDKPREKDLISNYFWYYLFKFGTALGDEVFYSFWFCFWFWNVDGAVGRRVVLLWAFLMYIGQGLKDIIRMPRPSCPPVIRLEKKWELEYGLPSTHAVVGFAVPFSTIIFTASRYQYPIWLGYTVAVIWCTLVCSSRLYLGMHSVLDIVAGLGLVGLLFIPFIPLVDWLDPIILTSKYGGLTVFTAAVFLCFCTPGGDRWTPARGDTFVILGSATGMICGAWLNFQLGFIRGPPIDPPYPVIWPSLSMVGHSLLRLVIGLCMVVATRAIIKASLYTLFHRCLGVKRCRNLEGSSKFEVFSELCQKFISYVVIGLNVVYLSPVVFRMINIERPTFHTEI